jgi:hypothetical protein
MSTFGTVSLRDFDQGVITSFGSELLSFDIDGGSRQAYAKTIGGLTTSVPNYSGKVPVFFANPEDVFQNFKIPCVVFRRTSIASAFDRAPFWGYQRAPSIGSQKVVAKSGNSHVKGYTGYAKKWNAVPFNIGYDVQLMARTQGEGLLILNECLRRFKAPFFSIYVVDTIGDKRAYDAGEVSISESSSINDLVDRLISWTISFEVRGELDLYNEEDQKSSGLNSTLITNYVEIMTHLHKG